MALYTSVRVSWGETSITYHQRFRMFQIKSHGITSGERCLCQSTRGLAMRSVGRQAECCRHGLGWDSVEQGCGRGITCW